MKLQCVQAQVMLHPAGIFPDGQSVAGGQGIEAHIRRKPRIQNGALNLFAPQGIDPVKDHHRFSGPAAGLHIQGEGVEKSIEPGAHILHIKAEDVEGFQHLFRQDFGFSVEGEHRKPGGGILHCRKGLAGLNVSADAVLRGEEGRKAVLPVQNVRRRAEGTGQTGRVGQQPETPGGKQSIHGFDAVNTGQNRHGRSPFYAFLSVFEERGRSLNGNGPRVLSLGKNDYFARNASS